jgi:hypothetical protein
MARDLIDPYRVLYEVISSPSSLVTSLGKDQWSRLRNSLRRDRDAWPKHPDADAPPVSLAPPDVGSKLHCEMLYPQHGEKGNHVALLAFRSAGFGVEIRITYWPISPYGEANAPRHLRPIQLTPTR